MSLTSLVAAAGAAALLAACGTPYSKPVGARMSPRPEVPAVRGLRAGFGRADITPPPGVGLAGNGPEGEMAKGQRLRLYARALVLEDKDGNRLAIVVADLPLGSALLHRIAAESTFVEDGIGVDRLIVAVTHTHSGPSHYFEGQVYNEEGSSVPGYDSVMVDSLARRVARAVHSAKLNLQDATIAWGSRPVWGVTRIRSLPAMSRNIPPPAALPGAPTELLPEYRLVDPEMTMLRVDLGDHSTHKYRPAGAFTIFAMHGTGNASGNELLDGDIHGIVERRLERYIDSRLYPNQDPSFVPHGYHLFANGTEGDVSPAWPQQSRCDVPKLATLPLLDGPFAPELWQWKPPSTAHISNCVRWGRQAVEAIGNRLGDEAVELYKSLEEAGTAEVALSRAYTTLPIRERALELGICPVPGVGMAALVGGADAHTRMNGVQLLGLIPIGLEQNSPNADAPGCHAQKHLLLDVIFGETLNRAVVTDQLPSYAQLTVFRIGDRVIGFLPGEATTTAGRRMRAKMVAAAAALTPAVKHALIVGLTNGYLEYITTAEEYTAQYYEGGSTLYGPGEAAMLGDTLAALTRRVSSNDALPEVAGLTMTVMPGKPKEILKRDTKGAHTPTAEAPSCRGDTLYAKFSLGSAHDWPVRGAATVGLPRVEVLSAGKPVAWDDDSMLEVWLESSKKGVARWEVRWAGVKPGTYQLRVRGNVVSQEGICRMAVH